MRYFPAGEVFLMRTGGRNVVGRHAVAENASARAPLISVMLPGCIEKFAKNGGSWM